MLRLVADNPSPTRPLRQTSWALSEGQRWTSGPYTVYLTRTGVSVVVRVAMVVSRELLLCGSMEEAREVLASRGLTPPPMRDMVFVVKGTR